MSTNFPHAAADNDTRARAIWRLVGTILGDVAALLSIFAMAWGFLMIGRGLGLN